MNTRLTALTPGMAIVYGGDKVTHVPADTAATFAPGDRLIVVQETGALLHVPHAIHELAALAVTRAVNGFAQLAKVSDQQITHFFDTFAALLESDAVWNSIALANAEDVSSARARGRSTTRLIADDKMRADMVAGLRAWRDAPPGRERLVESVEHDGWTVAQVTAPLGVVGFVFEGRPNVFADAAGVIRGGNSVVFRIGADALGTARAISQFALAPALVASGLPSGAAAPSSSGHDATPEMVGGDSDGAHAESGVLGGPVIDVRCTVCSLIIVNRQAACRWRFPRGLPHCSAPHLSRFGLAVR